MPQLQLDDENETLDWGNEEEEYQESFRRLHAGGNAEDGTFAGDDVEDTISLGDDEDDQRFYSVSRHSAINSAPYNVDQPASPPSSQSKSTASDTNTAHRHRSPEHQTQGAHVSVQERPMNQERSQKKSATHSPQRSLPRLTHALPPKPVAASVTALTQPFPAVAVTTITSISPRSAGRDSNKMNGNSGKPGLSPVSADLPQDWETRSSRKGDTYYYNRVTHECTWSLPGSKPSVVPHSAQEDSKSCRQRRSVSPGGNKQQVSIDSNPQNSRSNNDFCRDGEAGIEERRRPPTPDVNGLTFEDRHYRPGVKSVSLSDGIRGFDRSDISTSVGRYARSPSPHRRRPGSSPGSELDFRTKEIPRDQSSAQEKPAPIKTSSSAKLDSYRPEYDNRRWPSLPPRSPTDYHGYSQRERAHLEEDRMQLDPPVHTSAPSLRKEDISRDRRQRSRDRDLPPARGIDVREPSATESYTSAQRSRSSALLPPPREREHDIWDGKHEGREYDHHYEDPSFYNPRERFRQNERSHGPSGVQGHARGRERPIDTDVDALRGRNPDRERVREGERPGRDNTRREVNADDAHSTQHPPESYLPRVSDGDAKSKRNEDNDRKLEDIATARTKRAPLPPQQAIFRSAKLRDLPPHPISTPSKRPEETSRAGPGAVDDVLPRQPRNSSSTAQPSPLDVSRQPNGVDLERFHDGRERHEHHDEHSYLRDSTSYSDNRGVPRDDAFDLGRRQSALPDRRLPEDFQRSSNTLDSGGREQSPRPRASNNDRDLIYDKPKDEKPINRERSDKDVRPQLEISSSRRGRDAPRQPARLTGTNNTPVGNRRSMFADPEVGPSGTIPINIPRNLPPGKESYERPLDLTVSDAPRQSGPSRTESSKNRSFYELRQPQTRHDDEARGQKPFSRPLAIAEQYSNSSSYRPSTPPPLSRDVSGSILSSVPGRLSTYPSSDSRSDLSFRANQHTDPPRGSYRQRDESITRRDLLRHPSYSPNPDEAYDLPSRHTGDRFRKSHSGGAGPDLDPRFLSSDNSKTDRSDFLSRVEPPPLRRGGSLLDRLSIDNKDHGGSLPVSSTSLRDRLVPSKRDRDEMINNEASPGRGGLGEKLHDLEGSESKRARKRGGKRRSAVRRI